MSGHRLQAPLPGGEWLRDPADARFHHRGGHRWDGVRPPHRLHVCVAVGSAVVVSNVARCAYRRRVVVRLWRGDLSRALREVGREESASRVSGRRVSRVAPSPH